MARSSIYKSEVVRARDKLLAMGRYPSIDAVRIELGNTGSKGTIHRYLKEIEEEEGGLAGTKVAVSEAIQDLVARLAERLHEESDQRIAAFSEKQSGEVAALNETIASLRHDVESFRSQSEHLALSLSAEKSSHAETQTKLQDERIASAQVRSQRDAFMSSAKFIIESLHSLSVDLTRMMKGDISDKRFGCRK